MEKLIELLNEYEKETKSGYTWKDIDSYDNCVYGVDCDGETEIVMYSDLYSKCYGFIQRLVEQDTIDLDDVAYKIKIYGYLNAFEEYDYIFPTIYETLLMMLSIQENPISFLCSILR